MPPIASSPPTVKPEFPKPGRAYGVDPHRRERYSLRQARYDASAADIEDWAAAAVRAGRKLRVLDVACGPGLLLRHLEARPHFAEMIVSGTDLKEHPHLYRRDLYREFFVGDVMGGYPEVSTGAYDVVVCEQLLEHLPMLDAAIRMLERVLAPGGRLIVGVPIFIPPLAAARRHLVPTLDRVFQPDRARDHVQAFSLASFLREMRRHAKLHFIKARGFRVISGGVLRSLENQRWWWKLNRRLGELIPSACVEVQAIFEKPREATTPSQAARQVA